MTSIYDELKELPIPCRSLLNIIQKNGPVTFSSLMDALKIGRSNAGIPYGKGRVRASERRNEMGKPNTQITQNLTPCRKSLHYARV